MGLTTLLKHLRLQAHQGKILSLEEISALELAVSFGPP